MYTLELDIFQTAAVAVITLFCGIKLKQHMQFLEKYCIPSPVVGGLLMSLVLTALHLAGVRCTFNEEVTDIFVMTFFASVGFQVNLRVLRTSFLTLILLFGCVIALIIAQNLLALGISAVAHLNPLEAMTAGSVALMGGDGLAEIFGPLMTDLKLTHGTELCFSAATLGMLLGSLLGGPFGRYMILKHNLRPDPKDLESLVSKQKKRGHFSQRLASAVFQMLIAMGIGMTLCDLIALSGLLIPDYIGAMFTAIVLRIVSDASGKYEFHVGELSYLGGLCLSLFLGVDFATIALWQLPDLTGTQLIVICCQLLLMLGFAYLFFKAAGSNYDAAVLSGACCGFGLGASSSGVSSIIVLAGKYGYSIKAYLLVPLIGTLLADPVNSLVVTLFMRLL